MKKTVLGFMCYTDFCHELGEAPGGVMVYKSMPDILENCSCATSCGVSKVKVSFIKQELPTSFKDSDKETMIHHYRERAKWHEDRAKFCSHYVDKMEKEEEE